jgi:alkanesulfonate monooxygenase SsuD/methylene tetrahydromethanopterin reductase-like flavin-dependent oxidoreductase (luciferase family)
VSDGNHGVAGLEFGLQFTTHIAHRYATTDLVELARLAHAEGFEQIWLNDNFRFRQVFVVLGAIAQQVPIRLGTACIVPYFRNPMDAADALVTLSELTDGRELSVGIARGSTAQAGQQLDVRRPVEFVAQTVQVLKRLLEGERVLFSDYPLLRDYYHMKDTALDMGIRPAAPIRFYCGGNAARSLAVGGRHMDGIIWGGTYLALLKLGRVESLLRIADAAAQETAPGKRLRKVAEVNVAVDPDPQAARDSMKGYVAHGIMTLRKMGVAAEEFRSLGVEPGDVERLAGLFAYGASIEEAASHAVTDAMVRAMVVAGRPQECAEQLGLLCEQSRRLGFAQVVLAKLGEDYGYAIKALGREVLAAKV